MAFNLDKNLKENLKDISDKCGWGNYYTALGLPTGLCFGLAAMWGQAYLANDLKTFYKRLKVLTSSSLKGQFQGTSYDNLTDLIKAVCSYEKQLSKNHKSIEQLNYSDKNVYKLIISIRAFLDGLLAYHKGMYNLVSRDKRYFGQSVLKTSQLVISNTLTNVSKEKFSAQNPDISYQKNSTFIEIYNYPFIGNQKNYCRLLEPLIDGLRKYQLRCYIKINSTTHTIAFNSDLELYDSNNLGKNKIDSKNFCSIGQLVNGIFKAFKFSKESDKLSALNISAYISPKNKADQFSSFYNESDLKSSLTNTKNEIYNRLTKYINDIPWEDHKERAISTRNKLTTINVDDLYELIYEEALSPDNNLEYRKIIVESLTNIRITYTNKIIGDGNYYKKMLKNIFDRGYHKDTNLLYIACQSGHTEIIDLLLKEGSSDINKARNTGGSTPLYTACQNGHTEIVSLLLKNGADINKARNTGTTPLFIACQNGHIEIVSLLLKNGADINKTKNTGTTPLSIARQSGHTEIVNLLEKTQASL
ncbi:ankyrin repeat domain-containing protein [Allofrancisella guangzhouensis]|uniref:ankyrin repeat domain-containing protein n=1 Tax=Allofrancisella guangzhouensis TaxID=594679 RepID=UPI000691C6C8|nr:ankyrin repeat domain-containing protein [Allofrancisella guangzhouensis]MBK2026882.1 ankyrin repeat domain-containing protein [Allofrancisella guangzhouensis]MBK2044602.1 ankyrin repeat domain-containing protein [Allofrancisella guangzhouensis]MBK2045386.1 ankyrin repeat domain-containing protein [Allofrancisella guangzhouensis]